MTLDGIIGALEANLASVEKLTNFDTDVQELAIRSIEELHEKLKGGRLKIENPRLNGQRTLEILRGIRNNKALKPRCRVIYNQAVVLLVSYFGSVIGDLFRYASSVGLNNDDDRVIDVELKLRVTEVLAMPQAADQIIGDLLISKDDISFQDMKSTYRAFNKYFGIKNKTDEVVRNIIAAQACRHVIVHNGSKVNERTISQLRNVRPRSIKPELTNGQDLSFTIEEIQEISEHMRQYVHRLKDQVKSYEQSYN